MSDKMRVFLGVLATLLLVPSLAFAYSGPGSGLAAIGSLFAVLGAMVMGLIGFIWYPIKRLLKGRRRKTATIEE